MPEQKANAKKPTNPLYIAALPVGVLFAITACAFVVMTLKGGDPQVGESTGLMRLLDRHGVLILVVELAMLGVLTVGAIFTDDFWTGRVERDNKPANENVN
ncbi:MAG TPA: hypothetical protein VGI40_07910 [Pirellulaceae bacterium]|jgi:hypothetical protein